MTQHPTGPACGNNPNHPLSDGDRQAVAEFRAYLADRAALARIRQMADAWEQQFPDTIRTAAAVEAIRTALEPAAVQPPADRATAIREAIVHLRSIPVQCTALTGPVWYGTGWNEAITELEEIADRMTDEGAPKIEPIAADALARLLNEADVWWHKGDFPSWEQLSTAPGRGQDEYRIVARWLLKRLFVSERTPKANDAPQDGARP